MHPQPSVRYYFADACLCVMAVHDNDLVMIV